MQPYILMIGIDEDDRYITEPMLREAGAGIAMHFVAHLEAAYDTITANGAPAVILLNDSGAAHEGAGMLRTLKNTRAYNYIPVVILGEVSTGDYISECYRAGANTFIIKPSTLAETRKKIELFFAYWFQVAETR